MQSPAAPSFWRRRCTCMSTVRVWMSGCACHTVSSSCARLCTRPSRSINVRSSLNSVAVSSTSAPATVTRCAVLSSTSGPAVMTPPTATAGAARAQHRAHPQHELLRRKRLREVVVGAERQALDPVRLFLAGRQQDDADLLGLLAAAQLGEHIVAGHAGEHEVEYHEVGALLT